MNQDKETAEFKIEDIFEVTDRGAYLSGHILRGTVRKGMRILRKNRTYTISGIEYLDRIDKKEYSNAIDFKEKPDKDELEDSFRRGEIISDFTD